MSFSSIIKEELCRMDLQKDCCARAELAAVLCMINSDGKQNSRLITENAAFARRVYGLIKFNCKTPPDIVVRKNRKLKTKASYVIRMDAAVDVLDRGSRHDPNGEVDCLNGFLKKKCCKKAALRGAFLAGGSVSDPEKLYHLEIYCKYEDLASNLSGVMATFGIKPKIIKRTDYCVLYIKDSECIVDFLNVTGAHRALLSLENTRILKGMRNNVNRVVNCETANLEKTVNASLRQIANITYINETIGFGALPENLREIAALRAENREISLKELGLMMKPPLGKSGVNHRLRRLDTIAEEIKQKKHV